MNDGFGTKDGFGPKDGFGDGYTLLQRDGFGRNREEELRSKDSWGQNHQDNWEGISSTSLQRDGFGHDDWILGDHSLKLKMRTESDDEPDSSPQKPSKAHRTENGAAAGSEILNTQSKPMNCVVNCVSQLRNSAKRNLHPCFQLNAHNARKSLMLPLSLGNLAPNSLVLSNDFSPSAALTNDSLPNEALPSEALPSQSLPSESLPSHSLPSQPFPRTASSDWWF